MENEVLLNKLYEEIFKLKNIFKSFYENDFNKLGSSDFKNTVKSLNSFLFKTGYINNAIEVFRDDFFKKYIKEYSNLSSFTHAGSFSDEVFNEFNKQDNKQIILDNLLKDSFDLYLNIVNTTFLFYSLMNTELEKYYKEVNGINGI